MLRNIIKYGGLALVIIGIVLVMKNLFKSNQEMTPSTKKNAKIVSKVYYKATVSLLDEETKQPIVGASLIVKDKDGNTISEWTTEEGTHLVPNLSKGTYTLIEKNAAEGYTINKEEVKFEVTNKDQEVTMYNKKMTEEEKATYEKEQREKNTSSNEINVDNTLSEKDIISTVMALLCIISGITLISHKNEA